MRSKGSSLDRFCVTGFEGRVGDLSGFGGRNGLNPVSPGSANPGNPWGKPRKGKMSGLIGATCGGEDPAVVGVKYLEIKIPIKTGLLQIMLMRVSFRQ